MDSSAPYDLEAPIEDEPARLSARTVVLWLVAAALAVFLLTLNLASASIRSQATSLQAQLAPLQTAAAQAATPQPHELESSGAVARVETAAARVAAIKPTIAAGRVVWPAVIAAIGSYDPAQLALLAVTQNGREITLKGTAANEAAVAAYVRALEASALFERVSVQSMKTVARPFAPPAVTPTEASPTPTPTPDWHDAFEPDDAEPRDIFLSQAQQRAFCPADDVDQVRFLAKAGRFYRVFTSDLAPGVDTLLAVTVGDATFVNDDVKPGTLRSEVAFQVGSADVRAVVEVKNRGSYGPKMSYRLTAEEYLPTATPVPPTSVPPTSTPVPPTPTNTLLPPTATPTPTSTPTPTATSSGPSGALPASSRRPGLAAPLLVVRGVAQLPLPMSERAQETSSVQFEIVVVAKAGPQ